MPNLVRIDHGFSFPLRYLEVHSLQPDGTPHERTVAEIEAWMLVIHPH